MLVSQNKAIVVESNWEVCDNESVFLPMSVLSRSIIYDRDWLAGCDRPAGDGCVGLEKRQPVLSASFPLYIDYEIDYYYVYILTFILSANHQLNATGNIKP